MRLQPKIRQIISFVLFSQLLFICPALFCSQKGSVIILYGTSCAGKSTLAREFQKELPGNFLIVKRTALIDEKRSNAIEKFTGKRPKNRQEIKEMMVRLPAAQSQYLTEQEKKGLKETVILMKSLVEQGANVIFDVCTCDPEFLELFEDYDPVTILVYAPLSVLPLRLQNRKKGQQMSFFSLQRKKSLFLEGYCRLYQLSNDDDDEYLDTLYFEEVLKNYSVNGGELVYPELKMALIGTLEKFDLEDKKMVKIVPVKKPDLVIDSEKKSPKECCQMLKAFLNL